MKLRNIISIVLIVAIVVLAYFLYAGIMRPVKFDNEYNRRSTEVINKLKDIRTIEEAYKGRYGKYCGNFDSLMYFLENGKVNMVQKYGVVPDSLTEAQALKAGIIKRDTVAVNPLKKLTSEGRLFTKAVDIKDLKYIPYSNKQPFKLQADIINRSGIDVAVFEVDADISTYTTGMKEQDVINKRADLKDKNKYEGWKVGDITQPITDGNWE
jgi:hypothetical protein